MNEFCISRGSVAAFSDALDKTKITYVNSSGLLCQKLLKFVRFRLSYSKKTKTVKFFWTTVR